MARLLAVTPREPTDTDGVARIARRSGLRVERTGEYTLDVVIPG